MNINNIMIIFTIIFIPIILLGTYYQNYIPEETQYWEMEAQRLGYPINSLQETFSIITAEHCITKEGTKLTCKYPVDVANLHLIISYEIRGLETVTQILDWRN